MKKVPESILSDKRRFPGGVRLPIGHLKGRDFAAGIRGDELLCRLAGVLAHFCAVHLERVNSPDFPTTEGGKEPCFP